MTSRDGVDPSVNLLNHWRSRVHWTSIDDFVTKLTKMLEDRHPGLIAQITATLQGDVVRLSGEVGSENCRSDAKRLALSFDGIFKVRNELVVAGYLVPASDADLDAYFGTPAPVPEPPRRKRGFDSGDGLYERAYQERIEREVEEFVNVNSAEEAMVEVIRHPAITGKGDFVPASRVEISVDLQGVSSGEAPISIGRFPADWETIAVAVQLIAPWATTVDVISDHVTLKVDGTSATALFSCQVSPHFDGSAAQVQVIFTHGTRICGYVTQDLLSVGGVGTRTDEGLTPPASETPSRNAETPDRGVPASAAVRVVPDARGPSLTVTIMTADRDAQTWCWRAALPGGMSVGVGRTDLSDGARQYAEMLLRSCPDLAANRVTRTMDGIGEQLWRVAPSEFRNGYANWRTLLGSNFPIQFITEDPYVPWEMMKPEIVGAAHLFIDHPVARWPANRTGILRERLGTGDILSFVPNYPPGRGLPQAKLEGEWMAQHLGAVAMKATWDTFFDVLDGKHPNGVAVIHFAGHGEADTGQRDGGIHLEDGNVRVVEFDQVRTVVGSKCGTLVLLNACETSAGARMLGMNTGWGAAVAARDFGGLVAPLWEVDDGAAFGMMKLALPELLQGRETLGGALMTARRAYSATSASAFAYLVHGDVMATFPS